MELMSIGVRDGAHDSADSNTAVHTASPINMMRTGISDAQPETNITIDAPSREANLVSGGKATQAADGASGQDGGSFKDRLLKKWAVTGSALLLGAAGAAGCGVVTINPAPGTSSGDTSSSHSTTCVTEGVDKIPSLLEGYTASAQSLAKEAVKDACSYHLDPVLFVKQIKQESNFKPNAKSDADADGIAQFLPGTASDWRFDPWNAEAALDGGARYDAAYECVALEQNDANTIVRAFKKASDGQLSPAEKDCFTHMDAASGTSAFKRALIAYNAGPGAMYLSWSQLPGQTRGYIKAITGDSDLS